MKKKKLERYIYLALLIVLYTPVPRHPQPSPHCSAGCLPGMPPIKEGETPGALDTCVCMYICTTIYYSLRNKASVLYHENV